MRDVTDNVTGELDVTIKRGRGRPRKDGALTNAQRQAAYRARRKADGIAVTRYSNVPELQRRPIVHQVDAYDECRVEVDTLRAELAQAKTHLAASRSSCALQEKVIHKLEAELAAAKEGAEKTVIRNGNPVDFDFMVDLVDRVRKARRWDQRHAIGNLPGYWKFERQKGVTDEMRRALWTAVTGTKLG